VHWRRKYFADDPSYLKGGAVLKAPPVRRVFHIFGVDLATEFAYLYRHKVRAGLALIITKHTLGWH
jgi:hypothetical protein